MSIGCRGPKRSHRINRNFIGREGLLQEIYHSLQGNPSRHRPVTCLLHGLAGVGKTQIALELCNRYVEDYDCQFWVAAGNHEELAETFARIADIIPPSERGGKDVVNDVINWLETTKKSWIIVFDNVEEWPRINASYLPRQCSTRSAVMLTSQLTALAPEVDHSFLVGSLSIAEGARLIERHVYGVQSPTSREHDAATRISRQFSGFPAFMAHVGGFIAESASSIERYDKVFDARHPVGWKGQTHATIPYGKSIEALWEFPMGEDQLSPSARKLMMVMSFLDSAGIPESLLLDSLKSDPVSRGVDGSSDEARLFDMRRALRRRSLVSIKTGDASAGEDVFVMEKSLQHAILVQLDQDPILRSGIFYEAFSVIRLATPKANRKQIPNPKFWPQFRKVAAHIVSLCRKFVQAVPPMQGSLELAELLYDGGFFLWERQDYATTEDALLILSTSLKILGEVSYPPQGRLRADVLAIMGMCCDRLGPDFFEKALKIRKDARQIRQAINEQEVEDDDVSPTTDRLLYNSLNDQGIAEMQLNRFHEAEILFAECLRKYQTWGSEKDYPFEYAKYYHNMGLVRMCQGRFAEAVNFLGKAVDLEKLYEGATSSPLISLFAYHYACVLFHAGDVNSALEKHLEILAERELQPGGCSEMTLLSCYTIGAMHHHMGDLEKAEQYIKESIDRAGTAGCEMWPEYARGRAHMHLAKVMRARGAAEDDVKPIEAVGSAILSQYKKVVQSFTPTTDDDMVLYDALQPVLHGRYTGQSLVPLLQNMAASSTNGYNGAGD